mmetsp:Transcript_43898/g.137453  ORF Transcript_43898/g.137453 Transcript_43898/m.137453 type:complete len:223 (+) Transcript_43898:120-788(+)
MGLEGEVGLRSVFVVGAIVNDDLVRPSGRGHRPVWRLPLPRVLHLPLRDLLPPCLLLHLFQALEEVVDALVGFLFIPLPHRLVPERLLLAGPVCLRGVLLQPVGCIREVVEHLTLLPRLTRQQQQSLMVRPLLRRGRQRPLIRRLLLLRRSLANSSAVSALQASHHLLLVGGNGLGRHAPLVESVAPELRRTRRPRANGAGGRHGKRHVRGGLAGEAGWSRT